MKVLKSWLKDYIDFDLSDRELSDRLTFSGTLVEDYIPLLDTKIIVGEILEVSPHPNADRLRVAIVNTGKEKLQIVCGAPNIAAGQKIPLAMIGAKIGDFVINEASIRGIKSFGMLCSEKELGLGQNHEGIMILPNNYEVGKELNEYLASDSIFDLEITPNRGDCLSHLGVAREISAVLKKRINKRDVKKIDTTKSSKLNVTVEHKDLCPRYYAIKMKNIKIAPSPDWLQERLSLLGVKPISNVVDITNYIMLDLGQPLHAFDAKKVKGNINVRNARNQEAITTLDGNFRALSPDMLLIADDESPIAIAGVMGGLNSEIDENSSEIIIEAAEFERKSIRKTAKMLGLTTEASYRFERGIDPALVEIAADKAARMISEICGGEVVEKTCDINQNITGNDWVNIEYEKINELIGIALPKKEIDEYLKSLGFLLKNGQAQAPSWRHDVSIWQDLAEEVSRLYGFAKIPAVSVPITAQPKKSEYFYKEYIKDVLVDLGFVETYSYSFMSQEDIKSLEIDSNDLLEVANPIQIENKYLRKSLKPSLLRTVAKNPIFDQILIFEIGHVFTINSEDTHLGLAVSGRQADKLIKKTVETLSTKLGVKPELFPISELAREDITRFKIKKPITYLLEVNLTEVLKMVKVSDDDLVIQLPQKKIHYRPISKFPSIPRDLAFIVGSTINAEDVIEFIYDQSELINRVELFDEFSSDKFGKNKKNLAFHIYLQHSAKTLLLEEADRIISALVVNLKKKFSAELRNY